MASAAIDNAGLLSSSMECFDGSLDIHIEEVSLIDGFDSSDNSNKPATNGSHNIPSPPPGPANVCRRISNDRKLADDCCCVSKETKDMWDKLFVQGYGADVNIITGDHSVIPAHYSVLSVASPVLRNFLQQAQVRNGTKSIKIPGASHGAVYAFIRFIYSSSYVETEMEKFILHLLVLSHSFSISSLKKICVKLILERGWLTTENVIDVLQLARKCDAPRLSLFCVRLIVKDFKTISSTEGWKVMKASNPALEQELLESVVEADSRKEERLKKLEEKRVYMQLYEAMEALIHICKDGCKTIGPRDKVLKGSQVSCNFPACKGIETLVRHFSVCKIRVPGGCVHCKRMWQLLELHSCMCNDPDYCKVPLCRHFKEKMKQRSKKDEVKWTMLVSKVLAAKNALGPFFSSHRSIF